MAHQGTRARRTSPALLALNGALVAVLGFVTLGPDATAQGESPDRLRGEYVLVGGDIPFGNESAIYILDSANQEMVAVRWTSSSGASGKLEAIGYRDLRADTQARVGR
ncbi:MAG: hypothetical protein RIB60_01415 [Phycisphaerales bacterium]